MALKAFTQEQIIQLRDNPYTYKVTEKLISFTKEFKQAFYEKRQQGISIREAFISLGYDPEVLGVNRMEGVSYLVNKEARKGRGFHEGRQPRNSILDDEDPELTKENFLRLQHEVQYLQQEIEFLKKISSIEDTGKSGDSL